MRAITAMFLLTLPIFALDPCTFDQERELSVLCNPDTLDGVR